MSDALTTGSNFVVTSGNELMSAVRRARPGDVICYYVGQLLFDRQHDEQANEIGAAAWRLYMKGEVNLVQRRLAPEFVSGSTMNVDRVVTRCEYLAIRRAPKYAVQNDSDVRSGFATVDSWRVP